MLIAYMIKTIHNWMAIHAGHACLYHIRSYCVGSCWCFMVQIDIFFNITKQLNYF